MPILDAPTPERLQELRNAGWDEESIRRYAEIRTPKVATPVSPEEQQRLVASGLPAASVAELAQDRQVLVNQQQQEREKELLAQTVPISVEEANKLAGEVALEEQAPPIDVVSEWEPQALADYEDFSFESYVSQHPEVMQDNAKVAKLAEAFKIRANKPITAGDVGMGIVKLVPSTIKAIGKFAAGTGQTLMDVFGQPGQVALGALTGQPDTYYTELAKIQEKQLAEDLAGFEKGTFGFAQFVERAARGAARKTGLMRDLNELTPQELQTEFRNRMSEFLQAEKVGEGDVTLAPSLVGAVKAEQGPLDQERVNRVAEADPIGFFMFGQAFAGLGAGARAAGKQVAAGRMLPQLQKAVADLKQSRPPGDVTRAMGEELLAAAEKEAGVIGKTAAAFEESALGRKLADLGQASSDLANAHLKAGMAAKAAQAVPSTANRAAAEAAQTALQRAETAAESVFGAKTLATLKKGLANVSPGGVGVQAAGRGLEAAGATLRGTARVIEAAPTVGGAVAALKAAATGNWWAAGGILWGSRTATAKKIAQVAAKPFRAAGEKLQLIGKGVRTTPTSSFQQALRGLSQGSAETVAEALKGVPLDVGIGLALAETPEEAQNIPAFGSAFRAMHGAGRPLTRFVQSVKAGPRAPSNLFVPRRGGFLRQSEMFSEANRRAISPEQQAWLSSAENFLRTTGSEAPVYLLSHPEEFYDFLRTQHERSTGRPPTPEEDARLRNYSEQRGVFAEELVGDDGTRGGAIVVTSPDAVGHEGMHAFQRVLGRNGNELVNTIVRDHFSDQAWENEGQKYAEALYGPERAINWREAIRPLAERRNQSPDQYLAEELAAEQFDVLFRATGGNPLENPLTRKLANIVDRTARFFGVNLMEGVTTPGLAAPVSGEAQEVIAGVARGAPRVEPAAPVVPTTPRPAGPARPTGPAGPVGPAAPPAPAPAPGRENVRVPDPVQQRAIDEFQARTPERLNVDMARERANQSGDPVQTQVVEQIASALQRQPGEPVVLNVTYKSVVPGSPEERISRTLRRAAQAVPDAVRDLFEKRVAVTRFLSDQFSGGKLQLASMSLEKILANVVNIQQRLEAKGLQGENPYADKQTGELTEAGWRSLTADLITYTANQANGYRGNGKEIVLPADAEALRIAVPEVNPSYRPTVLPDNVEQFLNLIMAVPTPKTAREFKGVVPGNVKGQAIREATGEVTLEPGDLVKRQPDKQAFKSYPGRVVREVNPLRQRLEQAGVNTRDLFEVTERLNVDRVADAVPQYELRMNLPVTDVIRAGFLPKDPVKAAEENRRRGMDKAALRMPDGTILTGVSHFDALLQAINAGRIPQEVLERGVEDLGMEDGFVDFDGNFVPRKPALETAVEVGQITPEQAADRSFRGGELESTKFAELRQFLPAEAGVSEAEIKKILEKMERERYGGVPKGFTDQELFGRPEELAREERESLTGQQELPIKLTFQPSKEFSYVDEILRTEKEKLPRKVLAAAFIREDGSLLLGATHADAIRRALDEGILSEKDFEPGGSAEGLESGFVDNYGRFLDRDAAARLAVKADQLDPEYADLPEEFGVTGLEAERFQKVRKDQPIQLLPKKPSAKDILERGATEELTPEEQRRLAQSTARPWKETATSKIVETFVPKDESLLDFGAGPRAEVARQLRSRGYTDVTAHDFTPSEFIDPQALDRQYDNVMASNVLNVQSTDAMLRDTMNDILQSSHKGTKLIANYPGTPRHFREAGFSREKPMPAAEMEKKLQDYWGNVERIGGTPAEPVWKLTEPKLDKIIDRRASKAIAEMKTQPTAKHEDLAEPLQESGVPVAPDGALPAGPTLQFMGRGWKEWLDKYWHNNEEVKKRYSKRERDQFARGIEATAKALGDFSTVPAEEPGSPIRKNSDPMFQWTFDLTTVCPKQDQFVAVTKALERERGRIFTANEKALIGEMMRHAGYATCYICYGQSARNRWDEATQKLADVATAAGNDPKWAERAEEVFQGGSTTGTWRKFLDEHAATIGERGGLNGPWFRDLLRGEEKPKDAFEEALLAAGKTAAQGAVKANAPKPYSVYTDELLRDTLMGENVQEAVNKFNKIAGFRLNSQSDFRIWHTLDLSQFLSHLKTRDGMAHVYTRNESMLRVAGKTGVKFNLSVELSDPASLPLEARFGNLTYDQFKELYAEHGDPMFDDMNGFPEERMEYWRKQNPRDVGSMLVSANDYQTWWGLDSPKIDMMIAYHQGSVEPTTTAMYGARDYTREQHEHWPDDWKPGESRTRKLKDGTKITLKIEEGPKIKGKVTGKVPMIDRTLHQDNRERYLEILEKFGIKSKFERFSQHPNFMKLVRDAARNPMDQRVVDPSKIDWKEAIKLNDEWANSDAYEKETKPDPALLRLIRDQVAAGEWPKGPVIEAGHAKDIEELMAKKEQIKKAQKKLELKAKAK